MKQGLVLVLNCGSSSIKFALVYPDSGEIPLQGIIQRIGLTETNMRWHWKSEKQTKDLPDIGYHDAVNEIIQLIREANNLMNEIIAVGHRVVHGGEWFTKSVLIDDRVLKEIRACNHLAPLHNPAHVMGIEAAQKVFPNLPQVAVFDTAFHQTMPPHAYIYAIPYALYKDHAVRRYGFHGTSHLFVTHEAARLLNIKLENSAFISAHLGNGCSVTAVLNGKSVDTSMGVTPLEGLVMGTRSGDVDPSLHSYLAAKLGKNVHEITDMLNKESGLLGIFGKTSDMRGIEEAALVGDEQALLAEDIFCYRLAKYIAAYTVPLGKLDAVIFTGGIGENSPIVRRKVLNLLKIFGFQLDEARNDNNGRDSQGVITQASAKPIALVVPTNEEWVIARDAALLAKQ